MSRKKPKVKDVPARKTRQLSRSRKFLFATVAILTVFSSLEFVLWLCRVEPAYVQEDPYAGFSRHIPHFVAGSDSSGQTVLTVAPTKLSLIHI